MLVVHILRKIEGGEVSDNCVSLNPKEEHKQIMECIVCIPHIMCVLCVDRFIPAFEARARMHGLRSEMVHLMVLCGYRGIWFGR